MQSLPGLKKCINFVAGLSKKLLGLTPIEPLIQGHSKTYQKSFSDDQKPETLSPKKLNQPQSNVQLPLLKKPQMSKLISFDTCSLPNSDALRHEGIRQQTIFQPKKLNKIVQFESNNTKKILDPLKDSKGRFQTQKSVENNSVNKQTLNKIQIPQNNIKHQNIPCSISPQIQLKKKMADFQDEDVNQLGFSKKDRKNVKKYEKTTSVAQKLQINTNQIIFTYEDGDDISSIAAKSQTTDQIQPELLSFISKKGAWTYYNRFDEPFYNKVYQNYNKYTETNQNINTNVNMKKKPSHQQGEVVSIGQSSKKQKKIYFEQVQTPKQAQEKPETKKRGLQPYPPENSFQCMKKRVLLQPPILQSQSDSQQTFVIKNLKRQEENNLLDQLKGTISEMDEQKSLSFKEKSIQKMVDESENEDSQSSSSISILSKDLENIREWGNKYQSNNKFKGFFPETS